MKRLLTVTEAAEALRLNRATVWRWAKDGKIPAVRVGRAWRISEAAVEKLLNGLPEDDR